MWASAFADSGYRGTHHSPGSVPVPCAASAAHKVACRAAISSGVCGYKCGRYCYGVAGCSVLAQVRALVERLYARRGYRTSSTTSHVDSAHRLVFAGANRGQVIATITLGLDSPAGLLVDELYGTEIAVFRRMKRRICELSAFAVDPQYSSQGVLSALFHLAYLYGRTRHRVSDAFIEVNPRHAGFYERLFRFRRIGEVRQCPRVEAPAVLMHLDLERVGTHDVSSGESGTTLEPVPGADAIATARTEAGHPALMHD
ncbi:N-acyl amino acid synthase FeeM domain-containing protein [Aromatoleum petrolei]|uniref:N-acetyltransferase domain-containing protein n=1 Tax=Aromatoleum petrolei TaxID=76116 RepID=A0ABX1MVD4_9RHOO|nr:hypothetical protein [Aromatoleum petrolei]NMF91210.1 hypothetical protein [Aromatoleum petrolei]QTQ36017.1 Uncharacterized protein ToN1_18630 [Aromatoleum petrolei]